MYRPMYKRNGIRIWISLMMTSLLLGLMSPATGQPPFTRIGSFAAALYSGAIVTDGGISTCACWSDFDNDGSLDLFVGNWNNEANFLYRNDGERGFSAIRKGAIVTDGGLSSGGCWGDYDNDGYADLFVANQANQSNFLYHNDGNGTFTKITDGDIVSDYGHNHTAAWGDYDNDGFIDLFVADSGQDNLLYRNNGNGTFTRILEGDIVNDGTDSNGCSWADFDGDGDLDLFIPNKGGVNNFLFRNIGDGTFEKMMTGSVVEDGGDSNGGSWGDYDNDGDLDLFVTNGPFFFSGENNFLYRNEGDGSFTKIEDSPVVQDSAKSMSGCWGDFDNDGDLDLFVTNYVHDDLYYTNDGKGNFTVETRGMMVNLASFATGVGAGDYDNDGDLDLFLANWENQNNILYQNTTRGRHWIRVLCRSEASNRMGVGAKVRVEAVIGEKSVAMMREIRTNYGYRSQGAMEAHFGLGDAAVVESIRVEWPSGRVDQTKHVDADQIVTVTEGRGITDRRAPSPPAKESLVGPLFRLFQASGVDTMIQTFREWKRESPDRYVFGEQALNTLGNYVLVYFGQPEAARRIIELNLEEYPESAQAYGILGSIHEALGEKERAVEIWNYALTLFKRQTDMDKNLKEMLVNGIKHDLKNVR